MAALPLKSNKYMLFIILTAFTIFALILLIFGLMFNQDDMIGAGVGLFFLTIGLGWILIGNLVSQETLQETVTATVLHEKLAAHLSYSNQIVRTYTDVAGLNYLMDKTEIKAVRTIEKNLYGTVIETKWELSNER